MKLQIQDQYLRIRVDEAEFGRLMDGQNVATQIVLNASLALTCSVIADAKDVPQLGGTAGHWQVSLPMQALREHAAVLPSRDGLLFSVPGDGSQPLELRFDVDVRDSVRRRHPRAREPAD